MRSGISGTRLNAPLLPHLPQKALSICLQVVTIFNELDWEPTVLISSLPSEPYMYRQVP